MTDSEVKNLEAISKAIDQHNKNCQLGPAVEVRMNPFEVDRLDWDTIRGIPIVADQNISTGRFHLVCANDKNNDKKESEEVVEAVSRERELVNV